MLSEQAQTNELYTAKTYACIQEHIIMQFWCMYVRMHVHACTQVLSTGEP
jgi:hypothetical protein